MRLIAYYRVSTQGQGQSGLGLEAQQEKVQKFAADRGHQLVEAFVEVQSGKDDARPKLAEALAAARRHKAGIIVAKLDRLARSAAFFERITSAGVDVLFCDLPDLPPGPTGRFMVQLMASIAELEAGMISERTKAALQAAKARGTRLGGFRGTAASPKAREASAKARRDAADSKALELMPLLREIWVTGCSTNACIAKQLTERGIPAPAGGAWSPQAVGRVLARLQDIHQRDLDEARTRAASYTDWFLGANGEAK